MKLLSVLAATSLRHPVIISLAFVMQSIPGAPCSSLSESGPSRHVRALAMEFHDHVRAPGTKSILTKGVCDALVWTLRSCAICLLSSHDFVAVPPF